MSDAIALTHAEALQVGIDQLESDAEATESDDDAAYWYEAAKVLREILTTTPGNERRGL